ncbi:MAG: hypothetical protein RDU25_03990 [Patescibacteria group bacterium]|nr:hypothetical protein [Patescibacteria group bacterium]
MQDELLYNQPPDYGWVIYLIAGILLLVVLLVIIFGIWKLKRWLTRPEMFGMTREQMRKRWDGIRETSKMNIMGAKLAIFEADTLLDSGLKSLLMPGETLGERLKVACYKYPNLRRVWWAHKLRNHLAHDSSAQISVREANQALDEFERALKILNVL